MIFDEFCEWVVCGDDGSVATHHNTVNSHFDGREKTRATIQNHKIDRREIIPFVCLSCEHEVSASTHVVFSTPATTHIIHIYQFATANDEQRTNKTNKIRNKFIHKIEMLNDEWRSKCRLATHRPSCDSSSKHMPAMHGSMVYDECEYNFELYPKEQLEFFPFFFLHTCMEFRQSDFVRI